MTTATFTAGILIRRRIRSFLEQQKFAGRQIEWLETKGLIDSLFTVRGQEADVRAVYGTLVGHYEEQP